MHISQKGLNLIKEFEGCILQSYDDWNNKIINVGDATRGTLTIGYGHIENVYPGQTITKAQAEQMLKDDMIRYENQVMQVMNEGIMNFEVGQNQFDALVSFCYNLGQGCVRTLCRNRDKQTVADMMLEYRNKGSQWETGLLRRRKAERELFLSENVKTVQATGKIAELQKLCNSILGGKLEIDNIWGPKTDEAVRKLPFCGLPYVQRELTTWVQLRLGVVPDGIFGIRTESAVKAWQRKNGLKVDGIVGYNTYKSLATA